MVEYWIAIVVHVERLDRSESPLRQLFAESPEVVYAGQTDDLEVDDTHR